MGLVIREIIGRHNAVADACNHRAGAVCDSVGRRYSSDDGQRDKWLEGVNVFRSV